MKVVAKQGKNKFLVLDEADEKLGKVWDDKEKEWLNDRPFNVQSILARGYWDGIEGIFDPETKTVRVE